MVDKFIVELQVQLDQKGVSLEVSRSPRLAGRERLRPGHGRASDGEGDSGQPEKPLANELLFGSLVDGGQVIVELDKEKNALTYAFQSAQKHKPEAAH